MRCVQVPYSGFGMAGRALAMHAAVRVVRTVAFLSVVMPNARTPRCYAQRFPPVPDGMWDYFVAGANAVRGSGGCNDLILRRARSATRLQLRSSLRVESAWQSVCR